MRSFRKRDHEDPGEIRRQVLADYRWVINYIVRTRTFELDRPFILSWRTPPFTATERTLARKEHRYYSLITSRFTRVIVLSLAELNLSHNQMSKLPEELAELQALERLDISHNTFVALPPVVWRMPQLKRLLANNNFIIGQYRSTGRYVRYF